MSSRRKLSEGGLRIFWLNHLQIQTKFSFFFILSGFASDLAKKSGDPPGVSPDDFRRDNIAGSHGRYVISKCINKDFGCNFIILEEQNQ